MIPADLFQVIVNAFSKQQESNKKDCGRRTELTCSCGGPLHEDLSQMRHIQQLAQQAVGPRPVHRKKRIRKKLEKRWSHRVRLVMAMTTPILASRPRYVCGSCGSRDTFYRAIARNMFPVQPMVGGAVPYFDKSKTPGL